MYNFFIVRFTNRVDGTFGNSVKAYEAEPDALKEFFRQAGQAVDTTNSSMKSFCMRHRRQNPKR